MSIIDQVDAKFKEYNNLSEKEGTLDARRDLMAELKVSIPVHKLIKDRPDPIRDPTPINPQARPKRMHHSK